MTLFAHTETGQALDVQPNETAEEYLARFKEIDTSAWHVAEVPDGTEHGATPDGQGGWTNPAKPIFAAVPAVLSATAFNLVAAGALGIGIAGMARFQDIMDACKASKGEVKFCSTQYIKASDFAKDQVASFTSIMVAAGIMTSGERTAILNAWPTA